MLVKKDDEFEIHANPAHVAAVVKRNWDGGNDTYLMYIAGDDEEGFGIDKEGYERLVKWMEEHE